MDENPSNGRSRTGSHEEAEDRQYHSTGHSVTAFAGGPPVRGRTGGQTGAARLRAEHPLDNAAPGAIIRAVSGPSGALGIRPRGLIAGVTLARERQASGDRSNASYRRRVPVFRADHPFLFAIRHRSSGELLFVGRMADPTRSD